MNTSYDVRVWKIAKVKKKTTVTYRLRWAVGESRHSKSFGTQALADSFRSELLAKARAGLAFDVKTGLPASIAEAQSAAAPWLTHAVAFIDMKWPRAAAKHRRSLAEGLVSITMAALDTEPRNAKEGKAIRAALLHWSFNTAKRKTQPLPAEEKALLDWVAAHSPTLAELSQPRAIRAVLDRLALKLDGTPAAPTSINRKRSIFHSALKFAVEEGHLAGHPFTRVSWHVPKSTNEIPRESVVNPEQAHALIKAAGEARPDMKAFFGVMYYCALRPQEALALTPANLKRTKDGWGEFTLSETVVLSSPAWTDTGEIYDARQLKHRAVKATRKVPVPPQMLQLWDEHLEQWPTEGRLFIRRSGAYPLKPFAAGTYRGIWKKAKEAALTPEERATGLANHPYTLRHACVSLWLNAGVPPVQVAEWAGHSVDVLLRVYAKCIDGTQDLARQRIAEALGGSRGHDGGTGTENQPDSTAPPETQ